MAWELAAAMGFLVVAGVLAYFSVSLDNGHIWLKILFFMSVLFLLLPLVQYCIVIAEMNGASSSVIDLLTVAYRGLIIIDLVVVTYIVGGTFIYWIMYLKSVGDQANKKRFGGFD